MFAIRLQVSVVHVEVEAVHHSVHLNALPPRAAGARIGEKHGLLEKSRAIRVQAEAGGAGGVQELASISNVCQYLEIAHRL